MGVRRRLLQIVLQLPLQCGADEVFHGFRRIVQVIRRQIEILIQPGLPQAVRTHESLSTLMPFVAQLSHPIGCLQ